MQEGWVRMENLRKNSWSKIEISFKIFEFYFKKVHSLQTEYPLSINELKEDFSTTFQSFIKAQCTLSKAV